MALYQNTKNGQIVEFIAHHDKDWAMIKNSQGSIQYIALADLVSYEPGKGRTGETPKPQSAEQPVDEDVIPESVIPVDTRLNINTASAEAIAKAVKGIGYSTARKIVELRMSLSGERFSNLDQLKKIGRVDWDEVLGADLFYIG
ncbi:MAG: helix-hairpin-helix domain-containing protein [Bacteroidetes bacterium]|jgi:competence ComEA-like helix-hairpin-helix protein|nr:helix-hairpin-helix domain-containing protein [Bacteroidota bacterium]